MTTAVPQPDSEADGPREHFIPIRKTDIRSALLAEGLLANQADREKFHQFCTIISSLFHYEYYERLEKLRDDYYYFNPELAAEPQLDPKQIDDTRADLVDTLVEVLKGANFLEIGRGEIETAHSERHTLKMRIETPLEEYRDVRVFRRGRSRTTIEVKEWFGLRSRTVEVVSYDQVVLLMMVKGANEIASKHALKRLDGAHIRPGTILIKCFRNIARSDINMLFPNVRVMMSTLDKAMLGVPAVAGLIPIIVNLLPTITVLFAVIGFYLGFSGAVHDDDMKKALAAVSGLFALGGLALRQWTKYQRQSLRYQKELSDKIYFRNVNNNAGMFDFLVGVAEEQECKEAILAYYFLLTARDTPDQDTLDRRIEAWIEATFGVDVDFEVDDALHKLERLELLKRDGEKLSVVPLDRALIALDTRWDNFFPFANEAE